MSLRCATWIAAATLLLALIPRAGVAIAAFRKVDDRLLAHEIILLAHMRALKGWVFEGRNRESVLAEHLDLIFSRLRPL